MLHECNFNVDAELSQRLPSKSSINGRDDRSRGKRTSRQESRTEFKLANQVAKAFSPFISSEKPRRMGR